MTEHNLLESIREIFKSKNYPSEILTEIETLKEIHGIDRLNDEEIRELGRLLKTWSVYSNHPLIKLHVGYRYYENTNPWNCHFCGRVIKEREGYWAHKEMKSSEGPKLCHECFLKFLAMIDYNDQLYKLLNVFTNIDKLHIRDKELLLDKMKDLDFLSLITSLAEHYDEFISLKEKNESNSRYIERLIKIVRQYNLTEETLKVLSEILEHLKRQNKLLESLLKREENGR